MNNQIGFTTHRRVVMVPKVEPVGPANVVRVTSCILSFMVDVVVDKFVLKCHVVATVLKTEVSYDEVMSAVLAQVSRLKLEPKTVYRFTNRYGDVSVHVKEPSTRDLF